MTTVKMPGLAFEALRESGFPQTYQQVWKAILQNRTTVSIGRGVTVHIDLPSEEWSEVRRCMHRMVRDLNDKPYDERGMEGDVIMRALMLTLGRIDDATRPARSPV